MNDAFADKIIDITRSWVGTPYRHQCSVKDAGADCLGVLRGVWKELYGSEPEVPPSYQPDWYDIPRDDLLLRKAHEYLIKTDDPYPGDVLVFRMKKGMAAKHCGILVSENRMVHALTGRFVEEVTINHVYWKRCQAAFQFPRG